MDQVLSDLAGDELVREALDLVKLAGFQTPEERLSCEVIINSRDKKAVESTIALLRKLVLEKEAAYEEYKQGVAELVKSNS
jgi:hypothetical protein